MPDATTAEQVAELPVEALDSAGQLVYLVLEDDREVHLLLVQWIA